MVQFLICVFYGACTFLFSFLSKFSIERSYFYSVSYLWFLLSWHILDQFPLCVFLQACTWFSFLSKFSMERVYFGLIFYLCFLCPGFVCFKFRFISSNPLYSHAARYTHQNTHPMQVKLRIFKDGH